MGAACSFTEGPHPGKCSLEPWHAFLGVHAQMSAGQGFGGEDQARPTSLVPTSGWKAWQESGLLRSFWERILPHLTEALCAEFTVKENT